MLRTPLCDLLGIEAPVLCAPFGPWEQVELAAAVCEAGGLGSVGTALRPLDGLRDQWQRLRELTDRPFAINHTNRPFDEATFAASLAFRPPALSFHMAVPAELVARAHDAGVLWIQQVFTARQAEAALAAHADVLIAQGGEAGGNGGWIAAMVLVPQVVDLAGDVPVVAAGGIADGRGLAAALALGAQGVCMGTRFLATPEASVAAEWKERIVAADAADAVKVANAEALLPPFTLPAEAAVPRALRTPLTEALAVSPADVDVAAARDRLSAALAEGRGHEDLPFTGQSAGLIHDVRPAGDIVRGVVREAEAALAAAAQLSAPACG